jgi:phosphatidyl-myo-inositol dimannoside synthase
MIWSRFIWRRFDRKQDDRITHMRLLILDNEFPPLGGGTGIVNYYLMKEFDAHGVACDLVTSSRSRKRYEQEKFGELGCIYKVPVDNRNIHHSTNVELLRYVVRGSWQAYRLARHRPYDACLAFAGVPAGGSALLLLLLLRLPYVLSLQGPDVPGFEQRYAGIYPILKPAIKLIWRHAAVVTAISEDHRKMALLTNASMPIVVIPNGVDLEQFTPSAHCQHTDAVVVVCVGRLIERKGQHHLLQAVALLHSRGYADKVKLVLVGTGDMEAALKNQCTSLGLEQAVTFAGFCDQSTMPLIYQQADVFALPSFNEGMSIALLEAMSAGLPVIVTDTGGTAELVHDNGLVVPWADPTALANAIEVCLRQTARRQRMGEASRKIASQFSWSACAAAYLDLLVQSALRRKD